MDFAEISLTSRLLILVLALVSLGTAAPPAAETRRIIRVVVDNDYAPYVIQSDEGKLQGILIDQWREWEKKTGINVEIHAMDWAQALRRMRAGEFDVIDCIVQTPERLDYLDFTAGYATIEASIFFRNDISGITDLASLKGFPVGVKAGDQHIDKLAESGVTAVMPFRNNTEIVDAARQHKINVFVADAPSVLYLLNKMGMATKFRQSAPIFRDQLRRAVRKGDEKTLRAVSNGFAAIEPRDLRQIDEKWFGRTINSYGRFVTYAAYAAAAALLLIAGMFGWNHTLRRRILQRTAALDQSERRFRQIAENIHEIFWLVTADFSSTLYISPAYEAVWGRSCESLYRDPRSFIAAIHPEDRPSVVEKVDRDRTRGFEVEYRVVRPDSSVRWIWDRGFPIKDEAGVVYRVAGIAEDITERKLAADAVKQAEDRIRLIIDTIPTMAWSLRPDGVVDFLNQRWMDYAGLSLERYVEDPTGPIHPEDVPGIMEKWLASMASGEPSEDEMRLLGADGKYRWFLVRTVPLRDEQGHIVKWYGTSTDIEDRKQAEEEVKTTSEQLRALSARLHSAREEEGIRIAREIHDELGAALTSLRWELESIRRTLAEAEKPVLAGDLREKFEAMLDMTDRMVNMVRRIASDLRPAVLDVLGLEEAIEWQAQQFRERTGIAVQCETPRDHVALNPEQSTAIFRIFQEALTNIRRHAGATSVDVTMLVNAREFVLRLTDNGRGITEEEKSGQMSIGLLGMRERAHMIGGEIDVAAVAAKGTTVTVRLPLMPS
jgi:two-component system, cell cycle sensor histidine kinase and response regulator CckA